MVDEHMIGSPRTLKTAFRAFDVVRVPEELDGIRMTELANHPDLSKSVVYNYLSCFSYTSSSLRDYREE